MHFFHASSKLINSIIHTAMKGFFNEKMWKVPLQLEWLELVSLSLQFHNSHMLESNAFYLSFTPHFHPSHIVFDVVSCRLLAVVKLSIVTAEVWQDSSCPARLVVLAGCFEDSFHCHRHDRPMSSDSTVASRHDRSHDSRDRVNLFHHIVYFRVLLSTFHPRRRTRRPSVMARRPPWRPEKCDRAVSQMLRLNCIMSVDCSLTTLTTTCDASEKFGPGDRFLLGTGGVEFGTPAPLEPFRFLLLFDGRWASLIEFSVLFHG